METLNAAYGKNHEANMTPSETLELMQKVADAKLTAKPYRVRMTTSNEFYGECETDFNENGEAEGHEIRLTLLNDGILAHELAHARTNEKYGYHTMKTENAHGSKFQESLTEIVKVLEA